MKTKALEALEALEDLIKTATECKDAVTNCNGDIQEIFRGIQESCANQNKTLTDLKFMTTNHKQLWPES